ncbi:hypothetical protein ACN38_g13124 [Penicillium nordicum]|uniref:Uncharacterized protein n=1 Tax=Penicillium nordicum TaxID=229535 RepID=A0A0M9W997_9EURO|nr:hypothetical protein ACN38_g13124 [Penicillium nordicum]
MGQSTSVGTFSLSLSFSLLSPCPLLTYRIYLHGFSICIPSVDSTIDGYTKGETPFILRVKDLDNRALKFLSENHPRRRYLYLRLLISYLWSKRESVPGMERKVDSKRFWPSAGSYLQRSTLQALARCISGCEIPKDLTTEQTFARSNSPERNDIAGMRLDIYISSC